MFEKEDMTDMFSRAMLEKMQLVGKLKDYGETNNCLGTFKQNRN